MSRSRLDLDLTTPEPIPEAGITRAVELMRSGRLFRYGELHADQLEASKLEAEFAAYLGARYCVALNSGGAAMFVALKCAGVEPGVKVLVNAFTLAPVPGAVAHAGGETVWVESTEDCVIDLGDLRRKAESSGASVLLLSHMRGHIVDLEAVSLLCKDLGVTLIEDCAHTLGASWDGTPTGRFGALGCFSAQTFKHINAGEGGLLITDDETYAAKAILYSGSYMLFEQHQARPDVQLIQQFAPQIPNFSLRMSALAAAILRPQLALLEQRGLIWNKRYAQLAQLLGRVAGIRIPIRNPKEHFVASSIQFSLNLESAEIEAVVAACEARGVHIKWFGREQPKAFTGTYEHWKYVRNEYALERTAAVLRQLCDLRIPLEISREQVALIVQIISEELAALPNRGAPVT